MVKASCKKNRKTAAEASEKSIVNSIIRYLNKQPNCYVIKTYGSIYSAGQPDLIGCYKGRMLALEVKRLGGKPTRLQLAILRKWRKAGAVAAVVRSVDDVKEVLRDEQLGVDG